MTSPNPDAVVEPRKGGGIEAQLGVLRITAIVIAFSAPLAVVAGYLAVVIALGNGIGAPMAFLLTGGTLMLFAIGYVELVKQLPAAGGFYVYITAGLGKPTGLAGTVIALLSYFLLAAGTYAFLGLAAHRLVLEELGGPNIPWWVFVATTWLLSTILAYRELSVSAKVISFLIIFEFALILAFDVTVLFRGGAEGLTLAPLNPSNFFSGSPGLALLFSAGMFGGFESTAVYRDEARNPEKTIPRATFLTVGFLTFFYVATTYFLIVSMGTTHAVAIASLDPANTFPSALGHEFGRPAVIGGYVLLCTSLYGAALSMHNVLARYLFRMSQTGLVSSRLSIIHHNHGAPSNASLTAAGILGLLMTPFAMAGANPNLLYARQVGVGAFGFLLLLSITAISIIAFLRRSTRKVHPLQALVAPCLASISLFCIFALANANFVQLVGTSEVAANVILVGVYATGLSGFLWAYWLKRHKPEIFERIGGES